MKKQVLITLMALAAIFSVNFAFAVSSNGRTVQALTDTASEARQNGVIAKCEAITNNINRRISNFDHQKEQHLSSYSKTKFKIEELITKLEAKGSDVTKVKTDLTAFDEKVQKFTADFAIYKSLLIETKDYSCGKSEGDFRTKLKAARDQLNLVHQDAVAIRTFYAKTIRPDILVVKAQKTQTTGSTTNQNTEE